MTLKRYDDRELSGWRGLNFGQLLYPLRLNLMPRQVRREEPYIHRSKKQLVSSQRLLQGSADKAGPHHAIPPEQQ